MFLFCCIELSKSWRHLFCAPTRGSAAGAMGKWLNNILLYFTHFSFYSVERKQFKRGACIFGGGNYAGGLGFTPRSRVIGCFHACRTVTLLVADGNGTSKPRCSSISPMSILEGAVNGRILRAKIQFGRSFACRNAS